MKRMGKRYRGGGGEGMRVGRISRGIEASLDRLGNTLFQACVVKDGQRGVGREGSIDLLECFGKEVVSMMRRELLEVGFDDIWEGGW